MQKYILLLSPSILSPHWCTQLPWSKAPCHTGGMQPLSGPPNLPCFTPHSQRASICSAARGPSMVSGFSLQGTNICKAVIRFHQNIIQCSWFKEGSFNNISETGHNFFKVFMEVFCVAKSFMCKNACTQFKTWFVDRAYCLLLRLPDTTLSSLHLLTTLPDFNLLSEIFHPLGLLQEELLQNRY